METVYAIIKNATVQGANAEQNAYVVGAPSPLALHAYAQAYAFNAAERGMKIKTRWVLPIYHKLSERNLQEGVLKRESVGIEDRISKSLAPPSRDEVRIDFKLTLVIAFEVEDDLEDFSAFQLEMRKAFPTKMCGGTIFNNPLSEHDVLLTRRDDWSWLINTPSVLRDSHILIHRPDITAQAQNITSLLEVIFSDPKKQLSPIAIGYQSISDTATRRGTRKPDAEHVFVDPLISTGQWLGAYQIFNEDLPLYWVLDSSQNEGVFTLTSTKEAF